MPKKILTAVEVKTTELCKYNCGQIAKYKFKGGILCCSKHYNSCPAKRAAFSKLDHTSRTAKSLETRIQKGITKTSQIKGGKTRRESGHYSRLASIMQDYWAARPWQNNLQCPLIPFKASDILYQGSYEFQFLEALEKTHGIDWLSSNVKRGPVIWIEFNGKRKLYISDFQIGNTIYEIKSSWTWDKHGTDPELLKLNKAKLAQCLLEGYNVILVLNGKEITYDT